MLRLLALLMFAAGSAFALPEYPPLDAKGVAELDRQWTRLATRPPSSGARDLYGFLLTAVAHNWRPEKWASVITLVEELHDSDKASPTYGNYRWYWREPKPNDRNAVEFSMQSASVTWAAYHDRLPDEARKSLAAALAFGAEGMLRHKVDVSYTNIFLMRLANCILIGEALDRPDLVQRGKTWLDEWLAYTRQNGIHEYSSPTYYGTDLTDLGALVNFARDQDVRTKASAALRLLWTDIAANWFAPHQGIAGAHSRDYGFLTGHGYLDQQLRRAGWLTEGVTGESHAALDDVTFVAPPAELLAWSARELPRVVVQRWGPDPAQRSTHYVGRHFSLGSSGAGYGAQDKVLALTFSGGPSQPIATFSLDYRQDPYGQEKVATPEGHPKLTHLLPFIASVQRGSEVLLVASYDPARARNPAGGRSPIAYTGVEATFVLPASASLFDDRGPLPADSHVTLTRRTPLFVRHGDVAAALLFVLAKNDVGEPARLSVARDGTYVGAQRFSASLADEAPERPVIAAVWVRAEEGINSDAAFDAFRASALAAANAARSSWGEHVEVSIPGASAPLRIVLDPSHDKRLTIEGADQAADAGILSVNGRDIGGPLLAGRK